MMAYVVISVLFKIAYATEQIDASFTLLQLPNLQQLFYIARVLSLSAVWCLNVKKKKKKQTKTNKTQVSQCISPGLVDIHVYNLYACI